MTAKRSAPKLACSASRAAPGSIDRATATHTPTVLITGGDGYLGLRVARQYLRRTDDDVLLWVRASDDAALAAKRRCIERTFLADAARVRIAGGDLTAAAPFAGIDPHSIRAIVHAAANTRFGVPRAVAQAVNADGTGKLLAFAARCPRLERLALLSTVYACGLQSGRIAEAPCSGASGFANFYEWSKWEAEQRLLRDFAGLPWRLLRVATVIADDESGTVGQHNAVHHTLRLVYHGLLSLLPGDPATPLYFVTGDFAADAVVALTEVAAEPGIYHLAYDRAATCTLGEVVTAVFAAFDRDVRFRGRRILPPLYCDWQSFADLADAIDGFSGAAVKQAMRSVAPFARQLASPKDIDNRNLRARYRTYRAPDPHALIARTCAALLRTHWQRPVPPVHGGVPC